VVRKSPRRLVLVLRIRACLSANSCFPDRSASSIPVRCSASPPEGLPRASASCFPCKHASAPVLSRRQARPRPQLVQRRRDARMRQQQPASSCMLQFQYPVFVPDRLQLGPRSSRLFSSSFKSRIPAYSQAISSRSGFTQAHHPYRDPEFKSLAGIQLSIVVSASASSCCQNSVSSDWPATSPEYRNLLPFSFRSCSVVYRSEPFLPI
jgi:hypothetical protein